MYEKLYMTWLKPMCYRQTQQKGILCLQGVVLEYLTENTVQLLILFVAPGFISLKIWGLIHPSRKILISESLVEAIIFSSFNYITTIWLYLIIKNTDFIWIYFFIVLVAFPVLWPILLTAILNIKFLRIGKLQCD
jgi:hypothetical protein